MPNAFRIIRDSTPIHEIPRGATVAIGNFDGVHRGHRAVIRSAIDLAATVGGPALALTFEPHPRDFFAPATSQFRLSGETGKLRLLAATGLDGAVVMAFNAARAATTAQDFVNHELVEWLGVGGIVAGFDFHFGKGRTGTPAFLMEEGKRLGIPVHIEPRRDADGHAVSSGVVRGALIEGDVAHAASLLGYPWFITGTVIHGAKRGRELGFPTANILPDPACGLRHGIYAVRVGCEGRKRDGVASFGRRPMFDNGVALLEVFLFDFTGDLYGKEIDVAFIDFIRDEMRFDGLDALIRQMNDDSARARAVLAASGGAFPPLGDIS